MRYAHTDANQKEIVASLRELGYAVLDLALIGKGAPDLLVASPDGLRYWMLEVKNPEGRNRVEKIQASWHEKWPGGVHVVRSVDDALRVVGVEAVS